MRFATRHPLFIYLFIHLKKMNVLPRSQIAINNPCLLCHSIVLCYHYIQPVNIS